MLDFWQKSSQISLDRMMACQRLIRHQLYSYPGTWTHLFVKTLMFWAFWEIMSLRPQSFVPGILVFFKIVLFSCIAYISFIFFVIRPFTISSFYGYALCLKPKSFESFFGFDKTAEEWCLCCFIKFSDPAYWDLF